MFFRVAGDGGLGATGATVVAVTTVGMRGSGAHEAHEAHEALRLCGSVALWLREDRTGRTSPLSPARSCGGERTVARLLRVKR